MTTPGVRFPELGKILLTKHEIDSQTSCTDRFTANCKYYNYSHLVLGEDMCPFTLAVMIDVMKPSHLFTHLLTNQEFDATVRGC